MLPRVIALIAAFAFLNSPTASAQSKEHSSDDLLARLSYSSTYLRDVNDDHSQQICFVLYRDGYYRITGKIRNTQDGVENLQGTLSPEQLTRLRTLLNGLPSQTSEIGAIRKASESLTAEVVRDDKTIHFVWIDPDHERPFPDSAIRVVNWLQDFKAQDSSPLTLRELSDQPICPSASEKPLRPVVASMPAMSEGAICEGPGAANGTSTR
jgi:hypothetical protein